MCQEATGAVVADDEKLKLAWQLLESCVIEIFFALPDKGQAHNGIN